MHITVYLLSFSLHSFHFQYTVIPVLCLIFAAMQYWLLKSEPDVYSWDQLVADKKTFWNGVRNYQARNNLKAMKKGDLAFFYHSNEGKEIVGIAEICNEFYQDPTTDDTAWVCVDVKPKKKLKRSVSLEEIKKIHELKDFVLVKNTRLSVQPVTSEEFDLIVKLSEKK